MMKRTFAIILAMVFVFSPAAPSLAASVKVIYNSSISADLKGNGLKLPEGVAAGGKDLVVADSGNGRLIKYSMEGSSLKGGTEIRVADVPYPVKVQVNSEGEIFVLDGKLRRIARLSPEGAFNGYINASGIPSPSDFIPKSFRIDGSDNIYLLDILKGRVLVLATSGKYLRQVAFPEKYGFITDLAVGPKGVIYIIDGADSKVYEAPGDGTKGFSQLTQGLNKDLHFAANITVDSTGYMYLADQNGGGVVVLGPDGSFRGRPVVFGWKEGLVRYPAQLAVSDSGVLFVADRENSRVQVYTLFK
jgi:sugar lactone lactonase YvrE